MSPRSSPNELQENVLFYQSEIFQMGFEFDEQKIKLENLYDLNKNLDREKINWKFYPCWNFVKIN